MQDAIESVSTAYIAKSQSNNNSPRKLLASLDRKLEEQDSPKFMLEKTDTDIRACSYETTKEGKTLSIEVEE